MSIRPSDSKSSIPLSSGSTVTSKRYKYTSAEDRTAQRLARRKAMRDSYPEPSATPQERSLWLAARNMRHHLDSYVPGKSDSSDVGSSRGSSTEAVSSFNPSIVSTFKSDVGNFRKAYKDLYGKESWNEASKSASTGSNAQKTGESLYSSLNKYHDPSTMTKGSVFPDKSVWSGLASDVSSFRSALYRDFPSTKKSKSGPSEPHRTRPSSATAKRSAGSPSYPPSSVPSSARTAVSPSSVVAH